MTQQLNLAAALALAAAGLPVFPVQVKLNLSTGRWDKKPYVSGWQDKATSDENEVRAFWREYPRAAPGLALGRAGLIVLDADRHGGPDGVHAFHALVADHGLPPGVVTINTAGAGEHWVFSNLPGDPLGNGEGVLPGGINMRGRGGFIVAPGAVRPDGKRWVEAAGGPSLATAYREGTLPQIPRWLVQMLRPHQQQSSSQTGARTWDSPEPSHARERAYAAAALQRAESGLAAAQPGTRNNLLFKATAGLGSTAAAGWIEASLIRERLLLRRKPAALCGTTAQGLFGRPSRAA
jgi:hypothetical protein